MYGLTCTRSTVQSTERLVFLPLAWSILRGLYIDAPTSHHLDTQIPLLDLPFILNTPRSKQQLAANYEDRGKV